MNPDAKPVAYEEIENLSQPGVGALRAAVGALPFMVGALLLITAAGWIGRGAFTFVLSLIALSFVWAPVGGLLTRGLIINPLASNFSSLKWQMTDTAEGQEAERLARENPDLVGTRLTSLPYRLKDAAASLVVSGLTSAWTAYIFKVLTFHAAVAGVKAASDDQAARLAAVLVIGYVIHWLGITTAQAISRNWVLKWRRRSSLGASAAHSDLVTALGWMMSQPYSKNAWR